MMINGVMFALAVSLLPPCDSEDGTYCYWDAKTMGDGTGTSFVALGEDDYAHVDFGMQALCDTDSACAFVDRLLEINN